MGNIRRASKEDLSRTPSTPTSATHSSDDVSITRGREPPAIRSETVSAPHNAVSDLHLLTRYIQQTKYTGRGGAGNIRSTSIARAANAFSSDGRHTLTAALVSDQAEAEAEYERMVIAARQDAARNARVRNSSVCLLAHGG